MCRVRGVPEFPRIWIGGVPEFPRIRTARIRGVLARGVSTDFSTGVNEPLSNLLKKSYTDTSKYIESGKTVLVGQSMLPTSCLTREKTINKPAVADVRISKNLYFIRRFVLYSLKTISFVH